VLQKVLKMVMYVLINNSQLKFKHLFKDLNNSRIPIRIPAEIVQFYFNFIQILSIIITNSSDVFTIIAFRIYKSFKEYLLWFIFQQANWDKKHGLDQ
jgi:hypothetical protein